MLILAFRARETGPCSQHQAGEREGEAMMTFYFVWENGSRNDNGIKILKEEGIRFCYILQHLHAEKGGKWCPVSYRKINDYVWAMEF